MPALLTVSIKMTDLFKSQGTSIVRKVGILCSSLLNVRQDFATFLYGFCLAHVQNLLAKFSGFSDTLLLG